jgi:cation diffusion facilitator family transporter
MSCASENITQHYAREVRRVTLWGTVVNLLLAVVKCAAGLLAHSQALVADAVHSLSDVSTDIAVLVGVRYWTAPPDEAHPHGHGRLETLVSFFIGAALASVGIGLGYHALSTLNAPPEAPPGWWAFVAACVSIGFKEGLYRWTFQIGKRIKSPAVLANAWHHRSDALSSIPVAVAVLGNHINPAWQFLDSVATVVVGVMILHAAASIGWPAFQTLIDSGADAVGRAAISEIVQNTPGVQSLHKLRTRNIGAGYQVDIHIQVDDHLTVREGHDIASEVKHRLLENGPDVVDALIHIEPFHMQ